MVLKDPREKLMIDERNKTLWLCLFKKSLLEKVLSGVKHVRLDVTARDKGAPDKGHTTLFSSSKVVQYFPSFRSYFGMEYEQPWNMGKILLEIWCGCIWKWRLYTPFLEILMGKMVMNQRASLFSVKVI